MNFRKCGIERRMRSSWILIPIAMSMPVNFWFGFWCMRRAIMRLAVRLRETQIAHLCAVLVGKNMLWLMLGTHVHNSKIKGD